MNSTGIGSVVVHLIKTGDYVFATIFSLSDRHFVDGDWISA